MIQLDQHVTPLDDLVLAGQQTADPPVDVGRDLDDLAVDPRL